MASIQQGPTDWPLVGRSAQIELIDATYAGGTAGVVMLGEAGVGKTRLAREAWQRIAAQGCPAHWITATRSAAAVPLGALAPLLAPATDAAGNGTRGAAVHGGAVHGEELDAMARLLGRFPAGAASRPLLASCGGLWRQPDAVTGAAARRAGHRHPATGRWSVTVARPAVRDQPARRRRRGQTGGIALALLELGELLACGEPLALPMLEALTSHDTVQEAERRRLIEVELSGGGPLAQMRAVRRGCRWPAGAGSARRCLLPVGSSRQAVNTRRISRRVQVPAASR